MNLKTGLATAAVAAVVAALVTAATIVLVWRLAPGVVNVSSLSETKVIDIVRDYLTKNPEILVEMTNELDKRQAAEEAAKQQKVISDNAEALFRSPLAHVVGNANGDVSVVEFFDYNCGFCRRALPDVVKLVEGDDKLFNQYGVILVNPTKHPNVKAKDGQAFIDWLVSPEGQAAIASYKIDGQQLFFPNARPQS